MAIDREKRRKPSSLAQLWSVLPSIRSPAECRENLNILKIEQQGFIQSINAVLLDVVLLNEVLLDKFYCKMFIRI